MQETILALQNFWSEKGCLISQPMNTEVGAGTANPATLLRALGPEPWNVAYAEPSVRPDDSRYGINPNRLQTHTQFQVLLKPDPGNPQELYLQSLAAIGIDLCAHDVRFVEDNWMSPALGAWGLGWEVWLDGLEITQFTYFQQVGGVTLSPVAVEITYGLERIMMALQKVDHFKDIDYGEGLKYGDLFGQTELEMSTYYLDEADIARSRELLEIYSREAQALLDAQLPLPAYLYALKCSHAFNVLDSRGAVSTAERAKAFALMRGLVRKSAAAWAQKREELGYPLGQWSAPEPTAPAPHPVVTAAAPVVFEIGLEELPSQQVPDSIRLVQGLLEKKLAQTKLEFGQVSVDATPRRVVVQIDSVAPQEASSQTCVRGPRISAAFQDGQPTPALLGFLNANQVTLDDVTTDTFKGHEYVFVNRQNSGRPAAEVLGKIFTEIVLELRGAQNIHWGDPQLTFSRPIRWLMALYGSAALVVNPSLLQAGNTTRVLRQAAEPVVTVAQADNYPEFLREHGIILRRQERQRLIVEAAEQLAASVGGTVDLQGQAELIEEITDLVEAPVPVLGGFDQKYLELPDIVLTTVMQKHQRYLAVLKDGKLTNHFITFANGACDPDAVRAGNETVLRARFEDALFFQNADLKLSARELHQQLGKLVYEDKLGSYARRASRVQALVGKLLELPELRPGGGAANPETASAGTGDIAGDIAGGDAAGGAAGAAVTAETAQIAQRAAELAKFDLASQMVIEMPTLAGFMAKIYAQAGGESAAVAQALEDMEAPRGPGKPGPVTPAGMILSAADRLDQLAALFAVGAASSGSSDPFGIRRIAAGLVTVLRSTLPGLDLKAAVEQALLVLAQDVKQNYDPDNPALLAEVPAGLEEKIIDFILKRWQTQLTDEGQNPGWVKACENTVISQADQTLQQLPSLAEQPDFLALAEAIKRIDRLCKDQRYPRDDDRLSTVYEQELLRTFQQVERSAPADLAEFYAASEALPTAVNAFFDNTLVMDPDPALRQARLSLLADIRDFAWRYLSWSSL